MAGGQEGKAACCGGGLRDHVSLTRWQKTCSVRGRKVFDVFPSFCKPMLKKLGTMLFILVIRKIIHLGVICISCCVVLSLIPAAWVGGMDPKGLWKWKKKLTIVTICLSSERKDLGPFPSS